MADEGVDMADEGADRADGRGARPIVPARASSTARPWSPDGAAYAACAWAVVFAAASFYWAAGGTVGEDTVGGVITRLPGIVALLWVTGALKVIGALLALALVRPWGRVLPRWLLLTLSWAGGVGLTAYGAIPLVVNGLMVAGVLHVPGPVDWIVDAVARLPVGPLVVAGRSPVRRGGLVVPASDAGAARGSVSQLMTP